AVILQLRIPAPVEVAEQDGQRGPLGVGRVGRLRSLVPGSGALGFQGDPEAGVSGAGLVADLGVREPGGDFPSVVVAGGDLQTLEIVRNVRIVLVLYGAHVGDHGGGVVRVAGLLKRVEEESRVFGDDRVVVRPHLRLVIGVLYRIHLHDLLHGDGGRVSEELAGPLPAGGGVPATGWRWSQWSGRSALVPPELSCRCLRCLRRSRARLAAYSSSACLPMWAVVVPSSSAARWICSQISSPTRMDRR